MAPGGVSPAGAGMDHLRWFSGITAGIVVKLANAAGHGPYEAYT